MGFGSRKQLFDCELPLSFKISRVTDSLKESVQSECTFSLNPSCSVSVKNEIFRGRTNCPRVVFQFVRGVVDKWIRVKKDLILLMCDRNAIPIILYGSWMRVVGAPLWVRSRSTTEEIESLVQNYVPYPRLEFTLVWIDWSRCTINALSGSIALPQSTRRSALDLLSVSVVPWTNYSGQYYSILWHRRQVAV